MDNSQKIDTLEQFFAVLLHFCDDVNYQERIKMQYQSITWTRNVCRYMYEVT